MADSLSNLWNRLQSGSQSRLSAVDRDALKQRYPQRAAEIDAFFETLEQAADQSAAEVATAAMPGMDSSNDATLPPRQQPAVPAAVDEEEATLLPVQSSDHADEFATVIPINQDNDATLAPAKDATNLTSAASAGSRVRYFGDYELLSEIARGGMGVVYRAQQVNLNRVVALKMILAGQLASEEEVQRFRTEAEAAANLDHPGIVPIYEIGLHEGQHFFSMGYVDGCSLADRVRNGPLPPKEAAELTKKIAEAIAFAHSRNVIHRDLKPANVLLDQNGEPKVTDFGLARKTDNDSGMTRTGAVMGTPSYMPPEQAAGKTSEVGPLSDVYSLGAILYCLLTGRPPFQAANPIDTLMQVIEREPVALTVLNPLVPRDLETICLKCLQKDPAKRYESANDLAADIVRWQKGEPIRARAVTRIERVWRWVKRNPVVSGMLTATSVALIVSTCFGIEVSRSERRAITTLATSNYFLALARWNENRVADAVELLERIPDTHRHIEWYLARRQFDGGVFTCFGHTGPVYNVAFSPDGMQIASASSESTIRLWNATTGEERITLNRHGGYVNSVSFSPDGTQLVSGSEDKTIKFWELATGRLVRTLEGHTHAVSSVSFSPDGSQIVSGARNQVGFEGQGAENTIKVWDAATGKELRTLNGHTDGVNSVSFSLDGMRIVSGSQDKTIKVWDAATGDELRTLNGHSESVSSVNFNPDRTRIASGSWDKTVKIWDAATGAELNTLKGHSDRVSSVSFSPDGMYVVSSSYDKTVRIWDASTGLELDALKGHTEGVTSVSFSPDGTRIVSGDFHKVLKVWDVTTHGELNTIHGHTGIVRSVSFAPVGTRIVSGSDDGTVRVWDSNTSAELRVMNGHFFPVRSVSISQDGARIVSGSWDQTLKLWDAATGEELRTFKGHTGPVESVCFSPDGRRIVSGSWDHTVRLWDAVSGDELATLTGHTEPVFCVSFSPDGSRIASGSGLQTIKLWDAATGEELRTLTGGEIHIRCVSFSPDGRRIVAGSDRETITVWDAMSGKELLTLDTNGEYSIVRCVIFSPDGTRIISGSDDNTIKIWDAATGEELRTLKGHTGGVTGLKFNTDGTRLVSGSEDKTLKLWDTGTAEELHMLQGHTESVSSVSFSPNGRRMLSRHFSGTQILWDTSTGEVLQKNPWAYSVSDFVDGDRSPDGRWMALYDGFAGGLSLVDLQHKRNPDEQAFRLRFAAPKPRWHREQVDALESANNLYGALFHRAWLLKISPADGWLYDDLQEAHRQLLAANDDKAPPLPAVVSNTLKLPRGTELPQLNEESAAAWTSYIGDLAKVPEAKGGTAISNWHLQRMKDICAHSPGGQNFRTLGVVQYRLGHFEPAISSLQKSLELCPAEYGVSGPMPRDLAFLAMSYFKTNDFVKSNEMYEAFRSTASLANWNLQPDIRRLIEEVETTLQKSTTGEAAVSIEGFNREATFEGLYRHHWQFWPSEGYANAFGLASENAHDGQTCLQEGSQYGPVMAYQAVTVEPNTKYRLTGWIRYELPPTDPAGESTPAASNQAEAVEATATTETDSPSEPSSTPIPGASIGLLNRPETSEVISATTDWKQVTLEFTTTETETTVSPGFRLGLEGQQISGTAWFDDLKLEKVE